MSVTVLNGRIVGVHGAKNKVGRKSIRLGNKRKSLKVTSFKVKQLNRVMSKKVTVKRTVSQTSVANVTQAGANQASRYEELLDDAIYRCLHSLTKRHEPTKEFRAQFSRGAFLKPNTKAFIQVMHFLLNIYDAREFQKRFYWPIFDKAAENAFRTSSVEYVNSLIERGKLAGLTKIKAHVVVLPGGVKFMKFLLCIIRLVLQEEVRRAKGSASAADGEILTRKDIAHMIDRHTRWTLVGNQIRAVVKEEVALLSKKTEKNENLIEMILTDSELAKKISYDKLMQLWAVLINSQFAERQKLQQRTLALAAEFRKVIEKAEAKMRNNELPMPFTSEQLQDCLNKAALQNPDWGSITQDVFDEHEKLNPIKLVQVFQLALPGMEHFLKNFCFKNQEVIKYEHKQLSKVVVKLDGIRQQMDVLQRNLPILDDFLPHDLPDNEDSPEMAKCDNFAIKNKLFCTPPIVMDFEGHKDDAFAPPSMASKGSQRLALLNRDDVQLMNARMKLLSTSHYQPRSPRTQRSAQSKMASDQTQQASPNAFAVPRVTRKEKLNPLTMLNRIKAQSQKQLNGNGANAATLTPVNSTMNISTLSEITLRPEFSSTLLGTPEKAIFVPTSAASKETKAERCASSLLQVPPQGSHHQQMQRLSNSPNIHSSPRLMAIYVGSTETPKSRRSSNALLTVNGGGRGASSTKRNSLVNDVSVHTSPSGRLESVVKQSELVPPSEILVSEKVPDVVRTVDDEEPNTSDENTLRPENEGHHLVDQSSTLLATSSENQITIVLADQHEREGSLHTSNAMLKTNEKDLEQLADRFNNEETEEDDLFNVSDGVLTNFE